MKFGSVCSGIEAASVAWHPLGWRAAWLAEIEPFPSAVLAHHYPDVPNLGDMTALPERIASGQIEAPDVLAGGTPCQAFSIAGLRKGLVDPRGNLTLKFVEIADAIDFVRVRDGRPPAIVFWENVPGVLSSKDNAFGCFLGFLAGETVPLLPPGGRWTDAGCVFGPQRAIAWRVLDAQYFGLAQRRRRVFVVACPRNGADPRAILFESEGVRRDTAPRREAGQTATHSTAPCLTSSGRGVERTGDTRGQDPVVAVTCMAHGQGGAEIAENRSPTLTCTLRGEGFDASEDGTGRGTPLVPSLFIQDDTTPKVAEERAGCLRRDAGGEGACVMTPAMQVRRLTPVECERLQGFPDDYTAIPWRGKPASKCPDGPRYEALGNSWAVPVVRWIGERINALHGVSGSKD